MKTAIKGKKKKITRAFQQRLLGLVMVAFLMTAAFLWAIQTSLAEKNAIDLLTLNISDVCQDISSASDENLLSLTHRIAAELSRGGDITSLRLERLLDLFDVTEINLIDSNGIITASTYEDFLNYDMAGGTQSAEFLILLSGQQEYVQPYQPVSYDASISRKYAGVALRSGGFVQVGYDSGRFRRDIDEFVVGVTRNRHVGASGCIIILDEDWTIVSDRHGNEGKTLEVTGLRQEDLPVGFDETFTASVYGEACYCMYQVSEGYHIVAALPKSEAALSRNVSVGVTAAMQILVFAALFVMVFVLVKRLVVDNINRVNQALSAIAEGHLETVVDVRSHEEFDDLSNDINSTVDTLKHYIQDAEARIDAELALAKAIQSSALPSVFPPYPNHREIDIWATMYTAKEVGGDFYDFYFVSDEELAFLIADVSGKGIPAAMFMMEVKTLLKSSAEAGMSVEEIFTSVNPKLCESNKAGMFVTAWMGILNIRTGKVVYANAGHNPPLIRQAGQEFTYLHSRPGFVLAGMEETRYRKQELQLAPGDMIYLYTDGVTEATNSSQELYGEKRLKRLMNSHAASDPETVCAAVKADTDAFVGDAPQFDDITMLCLRYNG